MGAGRFAPALAALEVWPAALARRAPLWRQCVGNRDTAEFRRAPLVLAAWPPPHEVAAWSSGVEAVLGWALGTDGARTEPAATADLAAAVQNWSRAAAPIRVELRRLLRGTDPAILERLAGSERIGPPPAGASSEEREVAAREGDARRRDYCRVAVHLPADRFDGLLRRLWRATADLERRARELPPDAWPKDAPRRFETDDGFTVAIGTPHDDVIPPGWHLYLDPGGADDIAAGVPAGDDRIQASVDLGGDDHYHAEGAGTGGTLAGISVLIDAAGDDAYDGGRWSLGGAAFGGALLLDRGGDDAYAGRSGALGAAFHGIGLLLDAAGQDVYHVGVQGQGFAGPGGFGLLWDGAGNDVYTAGGIAPDTDRDPQNSLSMAQGCGFGLRPDAEGGTGLLIDVAGNDHYRGAVFAQGLGYWGGAGFLWDGAGDDTYAGIQYTQGTGLHFGLGVLSDGSGNDTYVAGGLAQGCGHDLGVGVCLDAGGADHYTAAGLAAGASSGGGVGLFWDGAGDDRYNLNAVSNLGCDASSPDRPGVAMHVDDGGRDRFGEAGVQPTSSAPAQDGVTWRNGRAGVAANINHTK